MNKRSGFKTQGIAAKRSSEKQDRDILLRQKSRSKTHIDPDKEFIFYYSNNGKPQGIPRKMSRLEANNRNHELALEHIKFMDEGLEKILWQWILNNEDRREFKIMNTYDHKGMVLCKNPIWGNIN